jgi:single-stranded-DNA-specific exonuclease
LRINQRLLNENDIGFSIAPRINAASRMGHPEDAFNLLSTGSVVEAEELVRKLESLNNKRRGQVAAMVRKINIKVDKMRELLSIDEDLPDVIVTGDPEWSPALVGLASGSLADSLGRVVCIWGREGTGILKGSCRAGGREKHSISIVEMFNAAGDALLYYGGHNSAGGFAVSDESVHTLSKELNKAFKMVKKNIGDKINKNIIEYDIELTLKEANEKTLRELELLAPYGIGNPKPVLSIKNISVTNVRHFGKEENHVEIHIKDLNGYSHKASKFFATDSSFTRPIKEGSKITLLANIEKNVFAGRSNIELRIVDIV